MTDESDAAGKPTSPLPRTEQQLQLVMTPQLQMALRLLATPMDALPALIAEWQETHPGSIAALAPGEEDPYDERERELAAEEGYEPFFYFDEEPLPPLGADVWIFGNPPRARANGRGLPRLKAVFDDAAMTRSAADIRQASWLVRALRQRARTYEQVVAAILTHRPELATAEDPSAVAPVEIRIIASSIGLHESTIQRVAGACRWQTLHGVMCFVPSGGSLGFRRSA